MTHEEPDGEHRLSSNTEQYEQVDRLVQLAVDSRPDLDEGEIDRAAADTAVNAIASAWSTFRLYPHPTEQPGFQQAMSSLAHAVTASLTLEVGAGSLTWRGDAAGRSGGSIEQLATRLYIHDVGTFTLHPQPDAAELCQLFELIAQDRDAVVATGGVGRLLDSLETVRFSVRGVLQDEPTEGEPGADGSDESPGRASPIAQLVDAGASPEEVHNRLLALARDDTAELRRQYIAAFRELHADSTEAEAASADLTDMLLPYALDDIGPSPTGTLIDVYFRLPEETRREILESFLVNATKQESRMFLDQFSGDELAEMVPHIGERAKAALIGYAQATAEVDGDTEAILSYLHSAREVRRDRRSATENIVQLLDGWDGEMVPGVVADIREMLAPERQPEHAINVIRSLFATVEGDRRFARLATVWAGRIRDRLFAHGPDEAIELITAVRDDPPYPPERTAVVDAALASVLSPDLIGRAAVGADPQERSNVIEFIRRLGPLAQRRVIDQLAAEDDAGVRRTLIDLLVELAQHDPAPLFTALTDERWYVVRNVVVVLSRTGLDEAIEPIARVADHDDGRVRVEVLRALVRLRARESTLAVLDALQDDAERVRRTALLLLPELDAAAIESRLTQLLEGSAATEDILVGIAEYLVERSPRGREAVQAAASKRLAIRKGTRATRRAAQTALKSHS